MYLLRIRMLNAFKMLKMGTNKVPNPFLGVLCSCLAPHKNKLDLCTCLCVFLGGTNVFIHY